MDTPMPTVRVHGLDYLDASPAALRAHLSSLLQHGCGHTVFTPNADIGAACQRDGQLLRLVREADVLLPDGAGVLLASRLRTPTRPLHYRLPGIEAGETVLGLCADMGLPVFFLGGRGGVAARAAANRSRRLPTLRIAGTHDGYFDHTGKENEAVLAGINESGAAVVLVCLGFPLQERWIVDNRSALPRVRLLMGLGGSFDVWAGRVARAPGCVQRLHLEWLWRMAAEPRRFRALPAMLRYVFSPPIREK